LRVSRAGCGVVVFDAPRPVRQMSRLIARWEVQPLELEFDFALWLIAPRMHHHASRSGYDRLVHSLPSRVLRRPEQLSPLQRGVARVFRPWIDGSGSRWYRRHDLINEIACARNWLGRDQIFHFLYGENSYRYLGQLRRLSGRNRIVATYHTPERRFREVVAKPDHVAHLDAAVVVCTMQRDFLQDWLPSDRVFFIPHGVDTDFYRPGEPRARDREEITCVSVGSHLRDYRTLGDAARLSAARRLAVRFVVVAPESRQAEFGDAPNVDWLSGLSDDGLLETYQEADILLLPLDDCTANNALLEGMAAGLPVLATELSGVRDYATEECAEFVAPRDPEAIVESLSSLVDAPDRLSRMAAASRNRALELDWEQVGRQMLQVYQTILS